MISVSNAVLVNPAGADPVVTRDDVWQGLLLKAEDALPFVPSMTRCEVLERYDDGLLREIEFRGQTFSERVTFTPKERVRFERVSGPVGGHVLNELSGEGGELALRFTFNLQLPDVEEGSEEERAYEQTMSGDYLKAVGATLDAVRRTVADRDPALARA